MTHPSVLCRFTFQAVIYRDRFFSAMGPTLEGQVRCFFYRDGSGYSSHGAIEIRMPGSKWWGSVNSAPACIRIDAERACNAALDEQFDDLARAALAEVAEGAP